MYDILANVILSYCNGFSFLAGLRGITLCARMRRSTTFKVVVHFSKARSAKIFYQAVFKLRLSKSGKVKCKKYIKQLFT